MSTKKAGTKNDEKLDVLTDSEIDKVQGGRSRGDTTLGDVVVVRELDKSSSKL